MVTNPELIKSIPKPLLKTLPAGEPPPGIQPNFINPLTHRSVILGVGTSFLVLAVICFCIRIYTKLVIAKKWRWDDLTCFLGFICGIAFFVAVVIGCVHGAAGTHIWDLHLDKQLNLSTLSQSYIASIVVTPALCLIKLSLFIQYYHLFRLFRWMRICVWIGVTISALFYVAVTIVAFVMASPWPGESLLDDLLSWHYRKFRQVSIPTGVVGMLVDWYLFILPIPAVWALQMSTGKKIRVLIIFMTGGLAAFASTMSLYYRVQLQSNFGDRTWQTGYVLLWVQVEMFAGVTVSSMPTVHKFCKHQEFSRHSWRSFLDPWIDALTHWFPRFVQKKLHNHDAYSPGGSESVSKGLQGLGMRDLEMSHRKHNAGGISWLGDSQILLTRNISVTRELRSDRSFETATC